MASSDVDQPSLGVEGLQRVLLQGEFNVDSSAEEIRSLIVRPTQLDTDTVSIDAPAVIMRATSLWLVPALVAMAELLLAFVHPVAGLILYACGIIAIFVLLARKSLTPTLEHSIMAVLTFVIIRLVSVSILFMPMPRHFQIVVTALTTVVTLTMAMRSIQPQNKIEFNEVSVPSMMLQFAAVLFGISIGSVFFALQESGLVPKLTPIAPANNLPLELLGVAAIMVIGGAEEALLRRLMIRTSIPLLGATSIILAACLQAALMAGYQSALVAAFAFGFGLIFGLIVYVGGSSVGVILGHACANFVIAFLGPYFGRANILPVALVCSVLAIALSAIPLWLRARAATAWHKMEMP